MELELIVATETDRCPLCVGCVHAKDAQAQRPVRAKGDAWCYAPEVMQTPAPDYVLGQDDDPFPLPCQTARENESMCGPSARYFDAAEDGGDEACS